MNNIVKIEDTYEVTQVFCECPFCVEEIQIPDDFTPIVSGDYIICPLCNQIINFE